MPPTAYHYTPNQVHNMQKLGPICRQRWPVDSVYGQSPMQPMQPMQQQQQSFPVVGDETLATSAGNWQDLQLMLMKRLMPRRSFVHLRPLFKRLASMEQSEDCLNLNVYAPLEGKLLAIRICISLVLRACWARARVPFGIC